LKRRRMAASYAPTALQARNEVLAMIPPGATVSRTGSMSLVDMGLWEELAKNSSVQVIDPYLPSLAPEVAAELRRQGLLADIMITSSNALTLDGKIVNLDGLGNRVAAMSFGPKKVILVIGMNKVAPDLDTAIARVKHLAAPINAIRLNRATPCVETGLCTDCHSPDRICNMWSIIEGHLPEDRIHVKLVGEDLGY
ncbi:MAG TPA: lactate utilization protein, partial [Methylomicrobium sp.]|nr:lactate utilization protein [Methylomicrobium sp.]